MAIYLQGNSGNIVLKTGGVPQSQINEILKAQEERLEAEHQEEINDINEAHQTEVDGLNTTIGNLNTEIDGLENEINELEEYIETNVAIPVEGVEF